MKHSLRTLINASCAIIGSFLLLSSLTSNAQFTSGRLVVARYGATGQVSAPTSAGTPTFLDEFTTAGAPGITVVLPTTTVGSTNRMLSSGSATSEGQLNLSSDGTVLLLGGYDAAAGTATINSTAGINRVIARIDNSGTVSTTVLTTTDVTVTNNSYTTSNFRSVASVDGSRYWTGGNGNASTGGVRTILYSGSSVTPSIASQVSSTTTNVRVVKIFNGQIYYSTASGIFKVGSGLPVISGTTSTALFTMQTGNSSPHSFVFLDRDPSVPGPDVMYVADDGTGASGLRAIFKYYFNGISWISLGSAVHTVGISGLTGVVNGSTAELYGSTSGSIVKLTDNSSFSTPITGSFSTLATAPTNTFFRGISFAPTPPCTAPSISGITTNSPICAAGSLSMTVSPAGTAPFTYAWTGTGTFSPSGTVSNPTVIGAASGVYTVSVSNACGSTVSITSVVVHPPLSASPSGTNVTCHGGNNGTATANPGGGSGSYTYSWFPSGGSGVTAVGLTAGVYTVSVTDASCGSTFATINITQPSAALSASCSLNSNVTCFGGNNGSATVNTSNAVGSLSYSWSPSGGSGSTAVGLTAGVYTVSVTDASCGSTFATINITQPSAPLSGFTFVINDANCLSTGDGRIGSNVNNAVGTVHYSWSPSGGTGSQATGLLAGTYTVTVSDDCSSFTSSQTINGPAVPMSVSCIPGSDVTCFGGNDGSASVNVFNSVGIVGYSWSPAGGSGPTATGLSAGTYTVTVSDYCATPTTCSVTITEPASALSVTCAAVNETSPGANNGSANVNPSGGSGGSLSYAWTPSGGSAATATGLAAGIYTVTVTDGSCGAMTCTSEVGTDCVSSTAATAASASTTEICSGNNVNLSLTGGSLGTGASWKWYEGGCGAGAVIGTGASITTGAITGAGIHTFYVRAEGDCGTTACVSVSITVTSGAPLGSIAVLSFPTVGCVGGSGSITCTSVAGATGYSWNGPAGILFNGNPGPYVSTSTTVALTYTALPPAGISGWNVCVFAKNACGNSANTKCSWIRSTLSSPNFSNASTIGCPSTTGIYTVATVDGAATYNWTITGGNASINGAGAVVTTTVPTVNIAFGAGFTGGTLCVSGTTACGYTGGTRCITITNAPLLPGAISGSTTLCPGSSSIFSIAPVDGAAAYIWTTTGTGVSVMGSGTSATVSTTGAFTSGSVCVVAVSTCGSPLGNSAQRCKTIGTGKLGTPGNISGDPTTGVCGQTYTYSIPSMAGATSGYTWTLPAGASGSSTTNSITLTFSGSFSSGILCVHGNNACGAGPDRCIMVYGNPGTPASLSGNTTPCAGGDEVYTWPAVPGASQYQVIVPVGYTVLSGTPTISNFAVINVTAASGQIGVKATNSCGVSGTRTLLLNPVGCRMADNQPEVKAAMSAQVYPNPASGDANIQFNSTLENDSYRISLSDLSGRALLNLDGKAVQGINMQVIDVRKFSAGIYLLNLQTGEGSQLIRLIIE